LHILEIKSQKYDIVLINKGKQKTGG